MFCMFNGCYSLNSIDLSKFNTNNVTDMSYIFIGCSSLNSNSVKSNDKKILQILKDNLKYINFKNNINN